MYFENILPIKSSLDNKDYTIHINIMAYKRTSRTQNGRRTTVTKNISNGRAKTTMSSSKKMGNTRQTTTQTSDGKIKYTTTTNNGGWITKKTISPYKAPAKPKKHKPVKQPKAYKAPKNKSYGVKTSRRRRTYKSKPMTYNQMIMMAIIIGILFLLSLMTKH